jgi:beta-lactamase regulating signal transducer with metallopeptidase domain
MDKLFLTVLNMSITGAFAVAAICVARLPLKNTPKIISYCLWAVAGFRLAFPFSIEGVFSLIPFNARTIPTDIAAQSIPRIDSGIPFVNAAVNGALTPPQTYTVVNVNPLRVWTAVGAWAWLAGMAVMLVFGAACYIRLKRRMDSAIRVEESLYETDGIQSPFVLGVVKPKIYIPVGLSEQEREYIVLHERTHIRRRDHIIKFAAYFILCLHWFNPLAWAAFRLMGLDMEMSCDELVLKNLGGGIKRNYSMSLLSIAADRRVLRSAPLAFGENGVEKRVKNVLKSRHSSRVMVALAIAFVAVLGLGLMVSRAGAGDLINTGGASSADNAFADRSEYIITDYYDEDGSFSDLGLAIDEIDSERALVVRGGDILNVDGRKYEVTVESLALSCYTQPSLDQVIIWWIDCLDSWAESGKVTALG